MFFNPDAGHSHLPAPGFVTDCPMCDAAKAARNQALAHLSEALLLLSQVQSADPSDDTPRTIRLNLAPIGLTGDDTGNCYSIDLTAKQAEALSDGVDSMNAYLGSAPDDPIAASPVPATAASQDGEALGTGEWSAAAVAQNNPDLYADVTDLFLVIDPQSYLDDVFAGPDPHESMNAYEQLVTGEWDGDL